MSTAVSAHPGGYRLDFETETFVTHSLRAMGHADSHGNGGGQVAVAFDLRNGTEGATAQTLQPAGLGSERGGNPNAMPATMQGSAVRRLTPRECERLQGIADDYLDITYRGKPAADGPKYKALGNSFAVPVVRWIGQRLQDLTTTKESP